MKPLIALFLLWTVVSLGEAQEARLSAGLKAGIELQDLNATFNQSDLVDQIKAITTKDTFLVNFGTFFDARFVELGLNFATQFTNTKVSTTVTSPSSAVSFFETNILASNLEMYLAAKLPLQLLLGLTVFPLVGAEYDLNILSKGKEALTDCQKKDLNETYLIVGLGADLYLTQMVYIRPVITAGINLNPGPCVVVPYTTHAGYKLDAGVALGFAF